MYYTEFDTIPYNNKKQYSCFNNLDKKPSYVVKTTNYKIARSKNQVANIAFMIVYKSNTITMIIFAI